MQNVPTNSSQWLGYLIIAIAAFFLKDGIVAVYNSWLNRKKPSADINLSDAQTKKTLAEATSIEVSSARTAQDAMLQAMESMARSEEKAARLQSKVDEQRDENDRLRSRVEYYERKERRRLALEAQRPRVLLVEDNEGSRELAMTAFRNSPFRLECARDGVDALEQYHDAIRLGFPFTLLVVDYSMPGMTGVEVVEEVRRSGDQTTKVLFWTAFPAHVVSDEAERLNTLGYVTKGDDLQALEKAILEGCCK
jgi:CheY-like chemotaxis protein